MQGGTEMLISANNYFQAYTYEDVRVDNQPRRVPVLEANCYEIILSIKGGLTSRSITPYESHTVRLLYTKEKKDNVKEKDYVRQTFNFEEELYIVKTELFHKPFDGEKPPYETTTEKHRIVYRNNDFSFAQRENRLYTLVKEINPQNVVLVPFGVTNIQDHIILLNNERFLENVNTRDQTEFFKKIQSWRKQVKVGIPNNECIEEVDQIPRILHQHYMLSNLKRKWDGFRKEHQRLNREDIPISLAICLTMYNESLDLFKGTMKGIAENVNKFQQASVSTDDIVVLVMVDGIQFFNEEFLDFMDKSFHIDVKSDPLKNPVRSKIHQIWPKGRKNIPKDFTWPFHVSERTCTVFETYYVELLDNREVFVNTVFCLKHANSGKLSSHFWFFRGFCEFLEPKYCLLVDCGTVPEEDAIYKLILAMEADEKIGGVCGHMGVDNPSFFGVEGAQLFEYKFAHLLDKAFEAFFGFIHVLPGAFSGYRWDAIKDPKIMASYLKLVENPNYTDKLENMDNKPRFTKTLRLSKLTGGNRWIDKIHRQDNLEAFSCREGNMYLAEDRILCLKIYAQKGKDYYLSYVPDAFCKTDVIDSFVSLMNQRRRWINGTWWAFWEVVSESTSVWSRGRGFSDKLRAFPFYFSLLYSIVNMVLMWFVVSLYYVIFSMSIETIFSSDTSATGSFYSWKDLFENLYVLSIILIFFTSLLFKAREAPRFYTIVSYGLGLFNLITTGMTFYFVYDQVIMNWTINQGSSTFYVLAAMFLVTIVGHAVPVIISGEIMTVIRGVFAFLFYSPSYINVLIIYSFANFDDLTWGNRAEGNNEKLSKLQQRAKSFKNFKMKYVSWFAATNLIVAFYLRSVISYDLEFRQTFVLCFGYLMGGILGLKSVGSFLFMFQYRFCMRRRMKKVEKDLKRMQARPREDSDISFSDLIVDQALNSEYRIGSVTFLPFSDNITTGTSPFGTIRPTPLMLQGKPDERHDD